MMERWEGRWENNVRRYDDFSCVSLMLPWSTRRCVSQRHWRQSPENLQPQQDAGIQGRQLTQPARPAGLGVEFDRRMDVARGTGRNRGHGRELHEAYTRYGMSRVSCSFCIVASKPDLVFSATCVGNQDTYRGMVPLEVAFLFAFHSGAWLGDIALHLLDPKALGMPRNAKEVCRIREAPEATIPRHLHYVSGWPTCIPTAQ